MAEHSPSREGRHLSANKSSPDCDVGCLRTGAFRIRVGSWFIRLQCDVSPARNNVMNATHKNVEGCLWRSTSIDGTGATLHSTSGEKDFGTSLNGTIYYWVNSCQTSP
jgi:hypothetical protein